MLLLQLCFLLPTVHSRRLYYTLDNENFDETLKNHKCTVVRYYTHHQEQSTRSFEDYNLVAKAYENTTQDLLVAGLDCGKYRRECFHRHVIEIPSVRIYCKNGNHFSNSTYEGGYSFESIIRWSSEISGVKPGKVHQLIHTPNNRTFKILLDNTECVFMMFTTPWCGACKRFMPRLTRVARLFSDTPNVEFAVIDSDRYRSFLRDYDTRAYPDVRLYIKGTKKPIDYDGKRTPSQVTEFINKHCGTNKEIKNFEGEAGLIDEANGILEEFFGDKMKSSYIANMKNVPHATFYVDTMEGLVKEGEEYLHRTKDELQKLLKDEKLSEKDKTTAQKKFNIIEFFIELAKFYREEEK